MSGLADMCLYALLVVIHFLPCMLMATLVSGRLNEGRYLAARFVLPLCLLAAGWQLLHRYDGVSTCAFTRPLTQHLNAHTTQ